MHRTLMEFLHDVAIVGDTAATQLPWRLASVAQRQWYKLLRGSPRQACQALHGHQPVPNHVTCASQSRTCSRRPATSTASSNSSSTTASSTGTSVCLCKQAVCTPQLPCTLTAVCRGTRLPTGLAAAFRLPENPGVPRQDCCIADLLYKGGLEMRAGAS